MPAIRVDLSQKIILCVLSVIAACFIAYGFSLQNGLSRDDIAIFDVLKTHTPSENALSLFRHLMVTIEESFQTGLFRPVAHLTFIVDYKIWELNPGGFHLTNLLLHIMAALMILWLCCSMGLSLWGAAGAAILFSVHPIQFETVGLIHNRSDILCAIFLLTATGAFYLYRERRSAEFLLASLISYALALLSKETAVVFPAIIIGCDYFCLRRKAPSEGIRYRLVPYGVFILVLLWYFWLRREILGYAIQFERLQGSYQFPPGEGGLWRPATALALWGFYLRLFFSSFDPFDFCADYFLVPVNSLFDGAALGPLVLMATVIYILWRFRPLSGIGNFGLIWFFLTYLPASNLVPIGNMFSQHFFYIPSAGLCIAAADILTKLWERASKSLQPRRIGIGLAVFLALVVLFWVRSTVLRNVYYRDDVSLWFYTAKHPLASPRAHLVLGQYYLKAGDFPSAQKEFLLSLEKNPVYHPANMMLGYAYKKEGQIAKAEKYFSRAARFAKERHDAVSFKEAVDELKSLKSANPGP